MKQFTCCCCWIKWWREKKQNMNDKKRRRIWMKHHILVVVSIKSKGENFLFKQYEKRSYLLLLLSSLHARVVLFDEENLRLFCFSIKNRFFLPVDRGRNIESGVAIDTAIPAITAPMIRIWRNFDGTNRGKFFGLNIYEYIEIFVKSFRKKFYSVLVGIFSTSDRST